MREKRSLGLSTRSDTNHPVQAQKKARILKFWIQVDEGLYYLCSEDKGADQLCSYCTANLRLCFRIGKSPVFSSPLFVYVMLIKHFLTCTLVHTCIFMLTEHFLGQILLFAEKIVAPTKQ